MKKNTNKNATDHAESFAPGQSTELLKALHILTREFGSLLTNALRCLQLEAHGYRVTVTELVGWEHSLKNELIIAEYVGEPRGNAAERIAAILRELNLDELHGRFLDTPENTAKTHAEPRL